MLERCIQYIGKKIAKPKKLEGLDIRKAEHQNKVYILNLIWRINHSPEKYMDTSFNNKVWEKPPQKKNNSILHLHKHTTDGRDTNPWYHTWFSKTIRQKKFGPLT